MHWTSHCPEYETYVSLTRVGYNSRPLGVPQRGCAVLAGPQRGCAVLAVTVLSEIAVLDSWVWEAQCVRHSYITAGALWCTQWMINHVTSVCSVKVARRNGKGGRVCERVCIHNGQIPRSTPWVMYRTHTGQSAKAGVNSRHSGYARISAVDYMETRAKCSGKGMWKQSTQRKRQKQLWTMSEHIRCCGLRTGVCIVDPIIKPCDSVSHIQGSIREESNTHNGSPRSTKWTTCTYRQTHAYSCTPARSNVR